MFISLGSAFLKQKTNDYFAQNHIISESLESEYQAFVRTNIDIAPLTKAINVYTHNTIKSRSFAEIVVMAAHNENLDPWLVFAVISKESSFNPLAKSYVGAKGLMQIMPFWKDEIGHKSDDLFNPHTSIAYGTQILRHYINRYGAIDKALAAYNGSKGSMKYPNAVMKKLRQGKKTSA